MYRKPSLLPLSVMFTFSALLGWAAQGALAEPAAPVSTPDCGPLATTMLRLAGSKDGLTFSDNGGVFLRRAGSPDLLRLPNGHLLAIFEHCPASGAGKLFVAKSTDAGRSWSRATPIVLHGPGSERFRLSSPALAVMRDRSVRVYFRMVETDAGERARTMIGSAVTRNGVDYEWDRDVYIKSDLPGDVRLCAAWLNRRLHVYVVVTGGQAGRGRSEVEDWGSYNGREFHRLTRMREASAVSAIAPLGQGQYRAFTSKGGDVGSLLMADRSNWREESGIRIPNAGDPAVVRLSDGSFLMLYCRPVTVNAQGEREFVAAAPESAAVAQAGGTNATATPGAEGAIALAGWEPFDTAMSAAGSTAAAGAESSGSDTTSADGASVAGLGEDWPGDILLPPKPDFQNRIDYLEWARQYFAVPAEDNSWDAYSTFCAVPGDAPGAKPWPDKIDDMFNGDNAPTPFPWDPSQYPNWEATHQQTQGYLDKFRQATQYDAYGMPLLFSPEQLAEAPNGHPLMFELLLPSLAQHRKLVRLTLADAWRAENGQLSAERMTADWQTALRGADHMLQGPTLIHQLVGIAEQSTVENTARRALTYGKFSEQQLQAALDTLREYDRPALDPIRWLPGEACGIMDAIQSLAKPGPDGQPQFDTERFKSLQGFSGSQMSDTEMLAGTFLGTFSVQTLREDADAADTYFRQIAGPMTTGYPQVRKADLAPYEKKATSSGLVTRMCVPGSMGNVLQRRARNEANRRATQLSYALHLYYARNGSWPNSLDQLGTDGAGIRTDPFTGRDFGYRLTTTGPTLYSLSENGTDEGGVHSKNWDDPESVKAAGGSDDYVFWPPQD